MRKQAFSLAEMIITLLILSIIMAASAPLITKRQKLNNLFDCFWQESKVGIISYAQGGEGSVGIGIKPENKDYILHLRNSDSDDKRNIAFYDKEGNFAGSLGFKGKNIIFGTGNIKGENNVIIGSTNEEISDNTLSIGPLGANTPLLFGNFGDPSLDINGILYVKPTENQTGDALIVSGGIQGNSLKVQYIKPYGEGSNSISVSCGLDMNSNIINNPTIQDGSFKGSFDGSIENACITNSEISSSKVADFSGNVSFKGNVSFEGANISGLKVDLSTGSIISSDKRLKDVIGESKIGLEEIRKVEIKDYKWKDKRDNDIHTGVMAQDFEKIFPNLVIEDKDGYLKIKPMELIFIVINAIKELDQKLQALKESLSVSVKPLEYKNLVEENHRLKSEIEELKLENKEITVRLEKLEKILK